MNIKNSRQKILVKASWVSTVGNAVLSLFKIAVGLISGSLAVLSDGIDSAADVASSVIMLFTSRIISRPPDKKYVFGYEKAESIATKILSLIIFYAGVQMLISTVKNIFSGDPAEIPGILAIYVTIFSIIGKLLLAFYQYYQGKKAESPMLIANAKNMRNDVIISAGVLLGLIFIFLFDMPILDSVTGLIISIFIIRSSVKIFMETNVELMDGIKDDSIYEKIFEAVEMVPEATNPHRVRSRQVGSLYMIEMDIEVDGALSLNEAHEIAERVEQNIRDIVVNVYDIVVHLEPKGISQTSEKYGIDKNNLK
ncbi:MAG: cation diffusion facilitator family transporter [Bacteroidales bacterium]|jgi:cation diffusion facilitator family transporter|nr:cation diffusion facilitator family transporter [Bacteroidales bacterium]